MFDDVQKIMRSFCEGSWPKTKSFKIQRNGNFFQLFSFVLISSKDKTRFCSNHNSNQRKLAMEKVRKKKNNRRKLEQTRVPKLLQVDNLMQDFVFQRCFLKTKNLTTKTKIWEFLHLRFSFRGTLYFSETKKKRRRKANKLEEWPIAVPAKSLLVCPAVNYQYDQDQCGSFYRQLVKKVVFGLSQK